MWLSTEMIEQISLFSIIFVFCMTLSLFLFFKLKEWLIDKSNNEELKKANHEFNEMIDDWKNNFK